jgi:hypothetical protein
MTDDGLVCRHHPADQVEWRNPCQVVVDTHGGPSGTAGKASVVLGTGSPSSILMRDQGGSDDQECGKMAGALCRAMANDCYRFHVENSFLSLQFIGLILICGSIPPWPRRLRLRGFSRQGASGHQPWSAPQRERRECG